MSRTPLGRPRLLRSVLELAGARAAFELQVRGSRRELEEVRGESERRLRRAGRERRQIEERLALAALHDPLTGLPNRILFRRRLGDALAAAGENAPGTGRPAVLLLDLDRFRLLNDSLGHHAGDELLRNVGATLAASVRPEDTVAHLGGDVFALLLPADAAGATDPTEVAERVRLAVARPFAIDGRPVFTGASVGIALSDGTGDTPERLLRDADIALHRAKERGRARCEVFDPSLHARLLDRLELETDLRRALERGEMRVAYQPILSRRHEVVGFEALLRWQHPARGLVSPCTFIPVAEETGLIVPLGEWVLAEVAGQLRRWRGGPAAGLAMSVNLSQRQLWDPRLPGCVAALARGAAAAGARLTLEITESAIAQDAAAAAGVLGEIRRLGVHLCLDDFGTGYSSLASLVELPVDALKLDRSFVRGMETAPENHELVRAVARLAHDLRLEVCAEGVETRTQLAALLEMEVDHLQGFLIAPPLASAAAEAFVAGGGVPWR
jgi:diguanylate cyclase (GGDEF)-like protein